MYNKTAVRKGTPLRTLFYINSVDLIKIEKLPIQTKCQQMSSFFN